MTFIDPSADDGDEVELDEVSRVFDDDRTGASLLDENEDEVEEPEDGEGGDEVSEGSLSPPAPEIIEFNGRQIPRDHAQNLVEFYDWARANPQSVAIFDAYLSGQMDLVPKGQQQQQQQAPKEPEPDLEELIPDPVVRREVEEMRAWRQQAEQQITQLSTTHMQSQVAQADEAVKQGQTRFQEQFKLSQEETDKLITVLANSNMLPVFAQQESSWSDAVYKGLETMYWATPEYREREMSRKIGIDRDAKRRQRKASSLGGSSGSVPRNRKPSTPDETRAAMVADIRAAMDEQ